MIETIRFSDAEHKKLFQEILSRMKHNDPYHRSVAYLMALVPMVVEDVFDLRLSHIKPDGLYAGWQTSSSRKATRLMFNLWNGCCVDQAAEHPEKTSCYYAVDEILDNYEYFPWFMEAIRIRFEWDLYEE